MTNQEIEPFSAFNAANEYLVGEVFYPRVQSMLNRINVHNADSNEYTPAYKQTLMEEFNEEIQWCCDDQETLDKLTAWIDEYGIIQIGREEV
mgnify:CR=1 FL=1